MSDWAGALVVLACTFGGMLVGMWLGRVLPAQQLSDETKDTVKRGMGLTATITAMLLALVTASAKGDYDQCNESLRRGATDVLMLDRTLHRYGPETADIRDALRRNFAARVVALWPEEASAPVATADGAQLTLALEQVDDRIAALSPGTDARRRLQSQALELCGDAVRTRWHFLESSGSTIPRPFLVIICWLTLIFASFGLLAPRNTTAVSVLFACALSAAAVVFLILEMSAPLDGIIKISSAPMRYALAHIGK